MEDIFNSFHLEGNDISLQVISVEKLDLQYDQIYHLQAESSSYTSHEFGVNLFCEIEEGNIEHFLYITYSYWHMCNVKKVLSILGVSPYFSVLNLCSP